MHYVRMCTNMLMHLRVVVHVVCMLHGVCMLHVCVV